MRETLDRIHGLETKIINDIKTITALLTPEVLEYAQNEKKFWAGAIGHIKRSIQLYALAIPSFELLEYTATVEDDEAVVSKFIDVATADLKNLAYPNVNRVYKLNLEAESKFDVIEEVVTNPEQAIFREPIGQEMYTREVWLEAVASHPVRGDFEPGFGDQTLILDEDVVSAAKNFMLGPCGAWRNKALLAETRTFDSLEELKESILKEAQEKDMVLYKVYSFEKVEIDWDTGKVVQDSPTTTLYAWRGCFIDKE